MSDERAVRPALPAAAPAGPPPALRFVIESLRHAPATLYLSALAVGVAAINTRLFTPEQYGHYSLVMAVAAPVIALLTEWVTQPIGRFYAEYARNAGAASLLGLVSRLSGWLLLGAPLAGVLVWLALRAAGAAPPADLYFGGVAVVALQSCLTIITPLFTANLRADLMRRATVGAGTLSVVLSLALIGLFGRHVALLLWGQALALCVFVPLALGWAGVRPRPGRISAAQRPLLARCWRYGWPMALWYFGYAVLDMQDRYIIQAYRGPAEVGVYAVSYALASGIGGLLNIPVSVASGPILFQHWAAGQLAEVRALLRRMTSLYLLVGGLVIGLVHVLGPALFHTLLGGRFQAGVAVLTPVLVGRLLWGVSMLGQKSLELGERTRRLLLNALLASALNLLLNLLLIPRYGYLAAAYTTTVSFAAYAALTWWRARSVLPWQVEWRPALVSLGSAVLAGALGVWASGRRGAPEQLPDALLGGLVFCLVYAGAQALLGRRLLLELRRPDRPHATPPTRLEPPE